MIKTLCQGIYISTAEFFLKLNAVKYISQFLKSSTFLILFANVLIYFLFNVLFVFNKYFGTFDKTQITSILFLVVYTILFFFAVPASVSKLIHKESLKELGLTFPKNKTKTIFLILFALLLLVPCVCFFAKQKQFANYSLGQPSMEKFIFIQLILLPLYYFAEEFFFRGFLFIGLWKRVGLHSFWITDIIFTYAHLGKPGLEILLSVFGSVIFNFLTLQTKSIYPAVMVHSTIGFLLSTLVTFKLLAIS